MNERGQFSLVAVGFVFLIIDFFIIILILGAMSPALFTAYNQVLAPNVVNLPNSNVLLSEVTIGFIFLGLFPLLMILYGLRNIGQGGI